MKHFNPFSTSLATPDALLCDTPLRVPTYFPSQASSVEEHFQAIVLDIAEKEDDDYSLQAHFRSDLGLDSLDMVELIMYCEKDFRVVLEEEEWRSMHTPGQLLDLMLAKVN